MFKSKLYWKVFANFALFLVIMTAMTVLTLNILSQIERNYGLAAIDMRLLSNLHEMEYLLVDVPEAADRYAVTGSAEAKETVERGWKDIDRVLAEVRIDLSDSNMVSILREFRSQFFLWMSEIGEKKIQLGNANVAQSELGRRYQEIVRLESSEQYLIVARGLYRELELAILTKQQNTISLADELSRQVANFITLINLMIAVFAVALGFVLTRSITTPVRLLKDGTQNIMAGKFEPIRLERADEFGQLASDFNNMSLMLGNNYTRLNAYSELVTALNTHADITDVQDNSLRLLCQHSGASVGALYLFKKGSKILEFKAGYALKPSRSIQAFTLGEGIPGECALQKKTIELTDLPETAAFQVDTGLARIAPRHIIATPIVFQDKVLGVIVLGSIKLFGELEKEIIQNSVPQIGVAITNARNNEAAQELSREIATKNEELNSKNQELEKAYRVKSDFLASMSHELRTPLNSIIGFSSVLLGPNNDPLTKDQEMALQKVLKNGKHLLQLINDILDFSKIESGRMTVNVEVDTVASIVSSSIATVESLIKSKGLKFTETIDKDLPDLKTDVLKVKQILVNLLSNAVKFTEKGEIAVDAKQDGSMVAIAVKDSGIGIEEKNLRLVFQEFQQIESSHSRKYKGTGLGLPISRRFAQMLGGDLKVESVFGTGSTFTLTVPAVYEAPEEPKIPVAPTPAKPTVSRKEPVKAAAQRPSEISTTASDVTILCIDDDPDAIDILKRYLVPEGYAVSVAYSGDEGIKLAKQIVPSLITLDIMMPQKDGWQVLKELKRTPETKEIPVIIHSMIDNKPLAISLGAVDVMPKPVDSHALISLIQETCKTSDHYVLVIDEDIAYAETLKQLIEREGFSIRVANSGNDALKLMEGAMPAMILIDVTMPGMDGFHVVRELNAKSEWRKIPVVILSKKELTEGDRDRININIQEYLNKQAFSQEAISKTIKRILMPA